MDDQLTDEGRDRAAKSTHKLTIPKGTITFCKEKLIGTRSPKITQTPSVGMKQVTGSENARKDKRSSQVVSATQQASTSSAKIEAI